MLLHRDAFTQRLLHTDAFTHISFDSFDTQRTEALYTQKNSQFYLSFWRSTLISCERVTTGTRTSQFYLSFWRSNLISCERGCAGRLEPAIFTTVFDDRTSFRAKGLRGTIVFDDRTSFRAKGLRGTTWNRTFTSVFDDRTSFRAKGLRGTTLQIAILPQFLAIEARFVRKGCVSCRLVGTAPAPAFRREIEK